MLGPNKRSPPNEVTWNDIIGTGRMVKIKKRKKHLTIAGLILLTLGLLCEIRVAFEFFPSLKHLILRVIK
ncbi:hypothetical protein ES703_110685 [subsurface metagenome]